MSKLVSGNKPTANTVTKPDATPAVKKFPGSGKEIPQGSKVTQTTSTNDKGQKVTTTSATRSGSKVPLDVKNKIRQRRGLPPIESGNTSNSGTNKPTGDTSKLIGMDKKTGQEKLNQMNKNNKPFDDFDKEINDLEANTPLVNSKGKKVKNIPGTNKMPSGGSNTQMNKDMAAF